MKVFILSIVAMCVCILSAGAQQMESYQDVVYLKDGSVIKGIIVEQVPNESLKIELLGGSVLVYQMSEVVKMSKERLEPQFNPNFRPKSAVGAGIASAFIPGLGQWINGDVGKGFAFFGASLGGIILGSVCAANVYDYGYNGDYYYDSYNGGAAIAALAFYGVSLGSCIWSIIDAAQSANRYNAEHGFAVLSTKDKKSLYINPDIRLQNNLMGMHKTAGSSLGMKLTLAF